MYKAKKRERMANFTKEETHKLISLIEANMTIIENKRSDAETWQLKEKTWNMVAEKFNRTGEVYRDAKHLKLKYEAMKRDIRKKAIGEYSKPGSKNVLTSAERRVKNIILSAEGNESLIDSEIIDSSDIVIPEENPCKERCLSDIVVKEENCEERCLTPASDTLSSTPDQSDQELSGLPQDFVETELKPVLKSKGHPALWKRKERRPIGRLSKRRFEIAAMQHRIIKEELKEMYLKQQLLRNEIRYKQEIHNLMKEEMNIKIEILKTELESKNKSNS